jgi:tyrosyl-tRNA synthetase
MLDKDIIRRRLDSGITFTEFSYMILQSLDFLHLHETRGVNLQVAGSDQWGNITAGVDLIRKKTGDEVYAFTMPLVTTKDGKKFGKSEGNALWLDKNKTSSYELYQYLVNVEDEMVIDYLKIFTFLSKEEIENIEKQHKECPEERLAHKTLAKEIITFIHGEEEYNKAIKISKALFSGDIKELNAKEIEDGFKDVPSFEIKEDLTLIDMLVNNNICQSRREAREFLTAGSITINGEKVSDENMMITKDNAIENKFIVVRRGKKKYYLGKFEA